MLTALVVSTIRMFFGDGLPCTFTLFMLLLVYLPSSFARLIVRSVFTLGPIANRTITLTALCFEGTFLPFRRVSCAFSLYAVCGSHDFPCFYFLAVCVFCGATIICLNVWGIFGVIDVAQEQF